MEARKKICENAIRDAWEHSRNEPAISIHLPGRVPNSQLYNLVVNIDGFGPKVGVDGTNVRFRVRVVYITEQQARFSDTRVANQHNLEDEIRVFHFVSLNLRRACFPTSRYTETRKV
jgi:hypothetical protein